MECEGDIQKFNSIIQEDRVYVFLDGLDDRLDKIRGDVLQMRPFPTVEEAYTHVRREATRQNVMNTSASDINTPCTVLATKSLQIGPASLPGATRYDKTKPRSNDGVKCSHCGNSKHTREACFKLHGYPDWWHDLQAKKRRDGGSTDEGTGRAAMATTSPYPSFAPPLPQEPALGHSDTGYYWAWY